jgi:uncharacterized alkaline shock family protein YloU
MSEMHRPPGKTTVSPGVVMAIVRMAALAVPGVKSIGRPSHRSRGLFRRASDEGIRMTMEDGVLSGDIYVVLDGEVNIRDVGREIQTQVARAIQEMVGKPVARIDVHVEDIQYEGPQAEAA